MKDKPELLMQSAQVIVKDDGRCIKVACINCPFSPFNHSSKLDCDRNGASSRRAASATDPVLREAAVNYIGGNV